MSFKIDILKSFRNFTGKHLRWSLFLKNLQAEGLQLYQKKVSNTGAFLWSLQNFYEQVFLQNTSQFILLHLQWLLLYFLLLLLPVNFVSGFRLELMYISYIPHRKYQVKPHSSPWLSAACAPAIVHKNHFFHFY